MTTVRTDFERLGDEAVACAQLATRGGAIEVQIGCFEEEGTWFAFARWRGFRRSVANQVSATAAATELAHKLLDGARCRCGRWVAVEQAPDGNQWCVWRRLGPRWVPGCDAPPLSLGSEPGDLAAIDRAFKERHGD